MRKLLNYVAGKVLYNFSFFMKIAYGLLLIITALPCITNLQAQNILIGIKGGISIPNLKAGGSDKNPLSTGYSSRFGPDATFFAECRFSDLFSLQAQIEYSSQGAKKNGLQAFPVPDAYAAYFNPGTVLYANFKSEVKLNYLMLPVLAKFGWNFKSLSPFKIYVEAGPFIGMLLSSKLVTSGSSSIYADAAGRQTLLQDPQSFDTVENIKNQLHSANFGVEANAGISYRTGSGNVFIEGGANYGFLNIQKGTANGSNTTGAATICLGYAFTLGRRK